MFKKLTQNEIICHLQLPIFRIIQEEADALDRECYVVGGFVRDLFIDRPSKDIDCVTVGSGIELAQRVAKRLNEQPSDRKGQKAHLSIFRNFGTAQVKYYSRRHGLMEVEFVGARKESYSHDSRKPVVEDGTLEDDQNRRDLTINDMAICLNQQHFGELIDPFGGMQDLEAGLIRTPLDPDITFSDDPLRMLRAIRFACRFDFKIVPETFEAIARNRERIKIISAERIIEELNKIMLCDKPSTGWAQLQRCGLLQIILPELQALSGIETKEGRGHKDNFVHTITVLDNVVRAQAEKEKLEAAQPKEQSEGKDNGNNAAPQFDKRLYLRWAALMHDLGKARAKAWDDKIGWTFHNHDYLGERMVPGIFRRLKLPLGAEEKFVQKMVRMHMRPINLAEDGITDSAIRRVLFEAGDDIDELMTLCEADITSKIAEKVRRFLDNFKIVRQKMAEIQAKDDYRNWTPPIDGIEIMQRYGLTPSKPVGILREAQKDAILDGECDNTREAALAFLDKTAAEMGLTVVNKG
ncbi:MAG: CCA tRNA nucleotidyltransferase [Bacteroidales bacterium]|nr:CCA tRNA nucleotidyltransferase [Bacteroidales bacterium]